MKCATHRCIILELLDKLDNGPINRAQKELHPPHTEAKELRYSYSRTQTSKSTAVTKRFTLSNMPVFLSRLFPGMVRAFTLTEETYRLDFVPQFTLSVPTHIGWFIFM